MCQYDNDKYAAVNFTSLLVDSIIGFEAGFSGGVYAAGQNKKAC
jgi:hypothetical protein